MIAQPIERPDAEVRERPETTATVPPRAPAPNRPPSPARPATEPGEPPTPPPTIPTSDLVVLSGGLRVGVARRIVEFDATISPLLHDPVNPTFYLEQLVCTPETKAHESFLVTEVRPSELHAALLASGLDHGEPGVVNQFRDDNDQIVTQRIPATGDQVSVRFVFNDPETGEERTIDPLEWIINEETGERFGAARLVFAGSNLRRFNEREIYDADVAGTIVGLTTFGTEIIGLDRIISHQSEIDEPVWIADVKRIPPNDWPVVVRIEGL